MSRPKGFKCSIETRAKISKTQKDGLTLQRLQELKNRGFQKGHPYGKRFNKGFIPWNKGIPLSYETRDKISIANISLCHRCHMKTNSNHSYWIEYFKDKEKVKCC